MVKLLVPKLVTKSDANDINALLADLSMPDKIMVGVSGDVVLLLDNGTTWLMPSVAAGGWHDAPLFKGIKSTGTTASSINVTRKRVIQ